MRRLFTPDAEAEFWPPRPSRFWWAVLAPLRWLYARRNYRVAEVRVEDLAELFRRFDPQDGILIAPNHCSHADPHVIGQVARSIKKRFYFMATQEIFRPHGGLDGWLLQRHGVFSVDRESMDRRAIRQAVGLLTTGRELVVFPEGEIYHLNERLSPLLDGVAFIALAAQRELAKAPGERRVWILPTFIRYHYLDDIRPRLESAMSRLEERLLLTPARSVPLHERIIRFGEVGLTIKEKEVLGHSGETEGDLPARLSRLSNAILEKWETTFLKKSPSAETAPLRVKAIRRHLLEILSVEHPDPAVLSQAREALDNLHLVLQLFSYRGDYVAEKPSLERMAETVEKFEEDIYGSVPLPKGRRCARVVFGEPLDIRKETDSGRVRSAAADVTAHLEKALQGLLEGSR